MRKHHLVRLRNAHMSALCGHDDQSRGAAQTASIHEDGSIPAWPERSWLVFSRRDPCASRPRNLDRGRLDGCGERHQPRNGSLCKKANRPKDRRARHQPLIRQEFRTPLNRRGSTRPRSCCVRTSKSQTSLRRSLTRSSWRRDPTPDHFQALSCSPNTIGYFPVPRERSWIWPFASRHIATLRRRLNDGTLTGGCSSASLPSFSA